MDCVVKVLEVAVTASPCEAAWNLTIGPPGNIGCLF
jgi:hypothetical protein